MEIFVEEHGGIIKAAIISVFILITVMSVMVINIKAIMPDYNKELSNNNAEFLIKNSEKFPQIIADDIIYAEYKTENFNIRDFLKAKDYAGEDITQSIELWGSIDTFNKGIYRIKCKVTAKNGLEAQKNINIVVE